MTRTVVVMNLAQSERAALADLFATLGPDQPTLCEGWDTRDLLTHLLVRERRPDAALGAVVKPLQGWTQKVQDGYAGRPWTELIEDYRSGPPGWNPAGWGKIDELTNSGEMFIHHEDARRGQPEWAPREFDPATTEQLAKMVGSGFSKLMVRKSPVGIHALLPNEQTVELKSGCPAVTIAGEPGEILLWLAGRDATKVELTGDRDAVETLSTTLKRGL